VISMSISSFPNYEIVKKNPAWYGDYYTVRNLYTNFESELSAETIGNDYENYRNHKHFGFGPKDNSNVAPSDVQSKQPCVYHSWKRYTGITEIFDYCTKCDEKKYNNKK